MGKQTERSPEGTPPRVSILIRTHNSERTIAEVLKAIAVQRFEDYEIVVVDSGSSDRTTDILRAWPHTLVDYSIPPFSYSGSLNAGCEAARGEYVVCLSSHCLPLHDEWLGRLVGALDTNTTLAGAWGPLLLDDDGAFSRRDAPVEIVDLDRFARAPTQGLRNSNSIIRKRLWKKRPFSEKAERCEDQDWARHFLERGYGTAVVNGSPVLYKYSNGFLAFAAKNYKNSLALSEMFGYEGWKISAFDLFRHSAWFVHKILRGEKSVRTSKLAIAGRAGRWVASMVVQRRSVRQGRPPPAGGKRP